MDKIELYNKILSLYKKTGQGTPEFIRTKIGSEAIDELVSDGLIKIVTQPFSHLPDSIWLCLTKGYCVEEEDMKSNAIDLMRMYLMHDPVVSLGKFKLTLEEAFRKPELVKKYSEWLSKNIDKLNEMDEIEPLYNDGKLDTESLEYIKTRGWYKDNEIVSECLTQLSDGDVDNDKQLDILRQLIDLCNHPEARDKYADKVKEHVQEKDDLEKVVRYRKKIKRWLLKKESDKKIQSLF